MLQSRDATVAFMYVDFTRPGVARPGSLTVEQLTHVGDVFRIADIRSDLITDKYNNFEISKQLRDPETFLYVD